MPFEVPEGWEWTTIDELCDVVRGGSPRPAGDEKYYNGAIPFLKVADLTKDDGIYVYKAEYTIKEAGLKKTRFINDGTLLLTNSGATLGVPKITTFSTTFNDGIAAFLYLNEEIQLYLYWLLKSKTDSFRKIDQGAAQPNLNTDLIKSILIPLPPLAEQHRIVAEIEKWFALIDQIEQGKVDLQTIIKQTKSKILDLAIHGKLVPQDPNDEPAIELLKRMNPDFTPCDNGHYPQLPNGWAIIKVGDAAIYVNGRAFKPEEWNNKGLPIIRIQNLNDAAAHYNYSCDVYEDKYLIHKGDLLFAWAASLGTYIWNGNEAWLNQHIFKVIPYPFMDKKFLYYAFKSMISDFITQSHGSGMVHITKKQFENITLLLPPLDEQKRIVQTLERYYKQIDAIMENL